MTPEQIKLCQDTWIEVAKISDTAAEIFYSKLFEADPSLKPLFKGDMKAQGAKLMKMIGTAVNSLTQLDTLVPVVEQLGVRHVDYGVKDKDYDTVGASLISTLEVGLGDLFTEEAKEAWINAYDLLSTTMINASKKTYA